jgi:hypothetical protein
MEDATMNDDLATRLAKLAPWQCQLLATALAHDPSAQPRASRLLAWIVPEADHTPTLASLRALLGAQLPDYMVPQQFIAADSLPRARSGKVDRAALRAHASGVGTAQRELQQAANGEERFWQTSGPMCWAWTMSASTRTFSNSAATPC